jgi:hypothetical protein
MLDKLKKFNSISFLVEGVLDDEINGEVNPHKEEMQKLAIDLRNQGKHVFLLTKYYHSKYAMSKQYDYLPDNHREGWKRVEEIANKIGLSNRDIIWSNRQTYKQLSDDPNHCHFDSSEYDTLMMRNYRTHIKTFNIKEENWYLMDKN